MALTQTIQPHSFFAGSEHSTTLSQCGMTGHSEPESTFSDHRSYSRSMSFSSTSSTSALRLADVAKQHGLGVHVDNWREDLLPVRQYLPMQHIIGSLKRDRDEQVQYIHHNDDAVRKFNRSRHQSKVAAASPRSEDSFTEMLKTPKRRRVSDDSMTYSQCSSDPDPDRRFNYQTAEQVKDISQAALPGLKHILNLATITAEERDIFLEYAPKHLDDSQLLMNEVLQLRDNMMEGEVEPIEDVDAASLGYGCRSPIIPPEREAEVRKAFDDFVDLNGSNRFVSKI